MEIKTIEQIKEEYARENGYNCYGEIGPFAHTPEMVDEIATRYASQFQERVKELEEHMKECASVLSWVLDNARPDSDWQTFANSVMNAMVEANSLINKGK